MTIDQYLRQREAELRNKPIYRTQCLRCRKPERTCFCRDLKPFASDPIFVILIHPMEARRSIATGRLAHLLLTNSYFFQGTDFSNHSEVNALIKDPENHCIILTPSPRSINLSTLTERERLNHFPADKKNLIFLIDGTWSQAKRMVRLSQNLALLPAICFTPQSPSRFLVRRQPSAHCYSTIEAIHECLRLLSWTPSNNTAALLESFEQMVQEQVKMVPSLVGVTPE